MYYINTLIYMHMYYKYRYECLYEGMSYKYNIPYSDNFFLLVLVFVDWPKNTKFCRVYADIVRQLVL